MRQTLQKLNIRFAALALAALLLFALLPVAHAAETGSCGNGVSWTLEGGNLTISGSGAMYNYGELSPAPWNAYAESIRSVTVAEGVTKIGNFAFFQLEQLTAVTIGDSVREIGGYAFFGCSALTLLDLGGGVQTIGQSAFELCTALRSVRLPNSLETLRFHAFYRCESLLSVTVPASVTTLESTVFAYCSSLRTATVLANIQELPHWTFYGCHALTSVSLTSRITAVGTEAFHNCENLTEASYGGTGDVAQEIQQQIQTEAPKLENFIQEKEPPADTVTEHSSVTTIRDDEKTVTTDREYTGTQNSTVYSEVISSEAFTGTSTSITIDAVLENADGWKDAETQYNSAEKKSPTGAQLETAQVNIYLKGEPVLSGADLARFAGKSVTLNIHTSQGAVWHIHGQHISAANLAESYRLSFTLLPLEERNQMQSDAVGLADSFTVAFHTLLDFKVEVELPLGEKYARTKAIFYSPEEKDSYQRMQAVVVDNQGLAHFYLAYVMPDTEYLIGINVGTAEVPGDSYEDAIIPDSMKDQYTDLEELKQIEYVITGRKSSWGMNIGQVTWIMVGVLVACVVVVGAVMFTMNKRRLKMGYIPETDTEDDEE